MGNQGISRRDLLITSAALGATLATGSVGAAQDSAPAPASAPSDEAAFRDLRIAYIGVGGIGGHHLEETTKFGVQCPCYAEVDLKRIENATSRFPEARCYQDYRELFDKEAKNFDAVMIGTPDHHHYPATLIAMQLGKHVYTQKPLTHTPWEARQLLQASRKYKVATQMGNQGHALEGWRRLYEWLAAGAIGDVTEVHAWTDRPIWPQGAARSEDRDLPADELNWDVWLGPAPQRPYVRKAYHPFSWRGWWDFGAGALGDMACHTMDGIFWALEPGHCATVEPLATTPISDDMFPKSSIVKWTFPQRGVRPPLTVYWYDGGLRPAYPADLEPDRRLPTTGNLFFGTKGTILVAGDYGESPRIIPETKMREIGAAPKLLERSPGHVKEWLLACVGSKPLDYPKSNFAYAAPFSETVLLGNVALRVGRKLEWDAEKMEFTNFSAANQYVTKEYRSGWKFSV